MPSDDDSLLTEMQVAELLQLHVQAVRGRRRAGTGSKLMWVGQWPRYRRSDVAVWLEANRPPGEPPRTLPDRPPGRSGAGGPGVGAPG